MLNEKSSPNPEVESGLVINKNGIISDSLNLWLGREWVSSIKTGEVDEQSISFLKSPIPTYEEYLGQYENQYPGITERTLANPLSNKNSIERFNQLVREYNNLANDLGDNSEKLLKIVQEAQELAAQS